MERKKHQAVTEAIDKKEQEVKVQKIMAKSLHEKIAKLEEESKAKKKDSNVGKSKGESPRLNRCMQPFVGRQV